MRAFATLGLAALVAVVACKKVPEYQEPAPADHPRRAGPPTAAKRLRPGQVPPQFDPARKFPFREPKRTRAPMARLRLKPKVASVPVPVGKGTLRLRLQGRSWEAPVTVLRHGAMHLLSAEQAGFHAVLALGPLTTGTQVRAGGEPDLRVRVGAGRGAITYVAPARDGAAPAPGDGAVPQPLRVVLTASGPGVRGQLQGDLAGPKGTLRPVSGSFRVVLAPPTKRPRRLR